MQKIENECVGCADLGLPCKGTVCPNRRVLRFYCDRCEEEKKLFRYDGEELCIECIKEELEVVEGTEGYDD